MATATTSKSRPAKPAAKAPARRAAKPAAKVEATPATNGAAGVKENPRTVRSREKFEEAKSLIAKRLEKGEWVSSKAIHKEFQGRIAEGMYGRVKSALNIQHRRVKNNGVAEYEWALPKKA